MPQTQEEIKRRPVDPNAYISPNFGDGGWHTTPGCNRFTTEWEPRTDHILVRLFPRIVKSSILAPEIAVPDDSSRRGVVLKVGPGKWIEGHPIWRGRIWTPDENGIQWPSGGRRIWVERRRKPMTVYPGNQVIIGRWHDWSSLEAGWGEEIALCQEADVRVVYR